MAQQTPNRSAAPAPAATGPIQRTRFRLAPPGVQVIIVSGLFLVTFLYFGGRALLATLNGQPADQGDLVFSVLVGGILVWRALGAVRGYALETGGPHGPELIIQRLAPWNTAIVSLARLRDVDPNPAVRSVLNTSMMSLGGLFGWSGPAVIPDLGPAQVYAINRERVLLLELAPRTESRYKTSDGTEPKGAALLLSPRDPQAMAAALAPFRVTPPTPSLPKMSTAPPAPAAPPANRSAAARPVPPPASRGKKKQ